MSNTAYFGNSADNILGGVDGRFFYGLRRTDDGELFITKVDQQMKIKNTPQLKYLGEKQGKKIYLGSGRYGSYLQIINQEEQKKNISIQKYLESKNRDDNEFTFEEAINFLKYPKKINERITIHFGPYGFYMKYNNKNYKIHQNGKYTEEYCLQVIDNQ